MQPARGRFARFDLDRQIASTFPAHWKVGPAPVFWASQPLEPAEWLALLILKAGDVESNPGPQNRKLPPSALTTQTTTLNSTTHSHATTSHPNQKLLTLLQLNINSITNKHEELKLLVTELQPDIITIQETKLKKHNKTPQIPTYSAIRTDRANGKGGGLLTYIKHNITFSDTKIPNFINPINTELQIIQLHITHKKIYTIANIYIPPRNTTSPDHATCDADITSCIQYITNLPNSIISGDINAHSPIWHSHTTDHRGDLIADLLGNSDHITLNTNTHHLSQRPPIKVLQDQTPSVSPAELLLSRETRRTLAQLRTNKSPLLVSYLFSIGDPRHPSPLCPLCLMHDHTSSHLFECKSLPTSLSSLDPGRIPTKWSLSLPPGGRDCWLPHDFGCWTLLAARWWSGVDNNINRSLLH